MIVGLGTEIVEVLRIGRMIERHGEHFLMRVFTRDELQCCHQRREYLQQFAMCWAAKLAVLKALGLGFARGVKWHDLEVRCAVNGQFAVTITGAVRDWFQSRGGGSVTLACASTRAYVTATAVIERAD